METDVHGRPWTVTLSFDSSGDFCEDNYELTYEGRKIEIVRGTRETPHNIHIECPYAFDDSGYEIGFKFFSELAWLSNVSVVYQSGMAGFGKSIISGMRESYNRYGNAIDLTEYVPLKLDERQRLALSLYREGKNSRSKFYEFLSYFKIISIINTKKKQIIKWINDNYNKIDDSSLLEYIREKNIQNVGEHFYISGRCAIAHASFDENDTILNADNLTDNIRIDREVRFMNNFAKYYMEEILIIPTEWDLYCNNMIKYFVDYWGVENIDKIKNDFAVELKILPLVKLGIYKSKNSFNNLNNLELDIINIKDGIVTVSNINQNIPFLIQFDIDFKKKKVPYENLIFGINKQYDSIEKDVLIDFFILKKELILNGRLEIFENDSNNLITRLPSYLPINIDSSATLQTIETILLKLIDPVKF